MTIYIEDSLIENFLVTYLILKCIAYCFKINFKIKRLFFSCIFASIIATFYPLINVSNLLLIILKLCTAYLIIIIAFNNKNILAKYLAFIGFTALYAGLNILIYYLIYGTIEIYDNFPTYILIALLFLIYYFTISIIKFARCKLAISNFVYDVIIFNEGKEIKTKAFLDSGNMLKDQDSTPIFIINQKLFNKLYKDISFSDLLIKNFKNLKKAHYVKSAFASGGSKILVFSVNSVKIVGCKDIEIKNAKLGIAYSKFDKNFDCDMLLNIYAFS